MKYYLYLILISNIFTSSVFSTIIRVPNDYSTIQAAINNSVDGDTILISPGTYFEQINLNNKAITIGSLYLTTGNSNYISQTIIDGNNGAYVFKITGDGTKIPNFIGLTIQNANDGIYPFSPFNIKDSHITNCTDGIDYENGSGGLCQNNTFDFCSDDGIDLDGAVDILIENNTIIYNSDDGIEIRLHPYSGSLLNYTIRGNTIKNNGEDGIQIIDYPDVSDRVFFIENNLIANNAMVGIGCMGNAETIENYEGYPIPEPIYIINNTIVNNNYGITGGANAIVKNNIIINHNGKGIKNITSNSLVSYGLFWNNTLDIENSNTNNSTFLFTNPLLDADYRLTANSEAIDAGDPTDTPEDNGGAFIDLGAFEFTSLVTISRTISNTTKYTGFGPNRVAIQPTVAGEQFQVLMQNNSPINISNNNARYIQKSWDIQRLSGNGPLNFRIYYKDTEWKDGLIANQPTIYRWNGTFWEELSTVNGTENGFKYCEVLNYSGSLSQFAIAGKGDQSLPVQLINFTAKKIGNYVQLFWKTAAEIDNLGFHIFRAEGNKNNNTSKLNFRRINSVLIPGQGNSNREHNYYFIDRNIIKNKNYWYKLISIDLNGNLDELKTIFYENNSSLPVDYDFPQNFPNPFNNFTTIPFYISQISNIKIDIYDLNGNFIQNLINKNYPPGSHSIKWDATRLSSGVYFYKIDIGTFQVYKKCLLIK